MSKEEIKDLIDEGDSDDLMAVFDETLTIKEISDKIQKLDHYLDKVDKRMLTHERFIRKEIDISEKERTLVKQGLAYFDVEDDRLEV